MRIVHVLTAMAIWAHYGSTAESALFTFTVEGTVTSNLISAPPLDAVAFGDSVVMSFQFSTAADCGGGIPECSFECYQIIQPSFSLSFASPVSLTLLEPFPPGELPLIVFYRCSIGHGSEDGFDVSASESIGIPISQSPLRVTCSSGPVFQLWQDSPDNTVLDIDVTHTSITLLSDLDADCRVDIADLAIQLSHFGTPSGAGHEEGDLDLDGDVDLADLTVLLADFGASCP